MLSVAHLDLHYGDAQALSDVSLEVPAGEIVAIIGANGAGKSSLIRAIAGMERPARGAIRFKDRDIAGWPAHRVCALGIGQVAEGRQIFPTLSVADNLALGAVSKSARGRAGERLAHVHRLFPRLKERERQLAGTLSGGEQQMVAIGRALMAQPELMLLDEPSLGLAPKVRSEIFGVLARLAQRGVTIVLVEQNLRLAARICSRAYLMQRGRVVGTESSEELARSARKVYLESHG